jgi:DNA-binding XRE family transcriptional regulator
MEQPSNPYRSVRECNTITTHHTISGNRANHIELPDCPIARILSPRGCSVDVPIRDVGKQHNNSPTTQQNYQISGRYASGGCISGNGLGILWMVITMRVRELRKQLGLPVDALAQIAGVSQRTITLWEKYGLPPRNPKTLEKIAQALGVEPDELFADEELFVPLGEMIARYERAKKTKEVSEV